MKSFFNITDSYIFDWADIDCITSIINVVLIFLIGFKASYFGLTVAVSGIVRDLIVHKRINGLIIHSTAIILNIYFLYLLLH